MSNIPQARSGLLKLADDLQKDGDLFSSEIIRGIVEGCLIRRRPKRPKPRSTSARLTDELADTIRLHAKLRPDLSQAEIAVAHGVNQGRVSEAIHRGRAS